MKWNEYIRGTTIYLIAFGVQGDDGASFPPATVAADDAASASAEAQWTQGVETTKSELRSSQPADEEGRRLHQRKLDRIDEIGERCVVFYRCKKKKQKTGGDGPSCENQPKLKLAVCAGDEYQWRRWSCGVMAHGLGQGKSETDKKNLEVYSSIDNYGAPLNLDQAKAWCYPSGAGEAEGGIMAMMEARDDERESLLEEEAAEDIRRASPPPRSPGVCAKLPEADCKVGCTWDRAEGKCRPWPSLAVA